MGITFFKIAKIYEIKQVITEKFKNNPARIISLFLISVIVTNILLVVTREYGRKELNLSFILKLSLLLLAFLGLFARIKLKAVLEKSLFVRLCKKLNLLFKNG